MSVRSQLGKYLREYPRWHFAPPRVEAARPLERFGSDYAGYRVDTSLLHRDAVVYSLGVGEDVTFDLGLIERFGNNVEAFDPTPKVKQWIAGQRLPQQFHFFNCGIANFDGEAAFYLPPRPDYISHSVVASREFKSESTKIAVKRLRTAMRDLGHTSIDLLKMDIEGAEYGVLEDLISEKIPVRQLVVEFHHRFASIGIEKTRQILSRLRAYGMQICYVCPRFDVITLIQAS